MKIQDTLQSRFRDSVPIAYLDWAVDCQTAYKVASVDLHHAVVTSPLPGSEVFLPSSGNRAFVLLPSPAEIPSGLIAIEIGKHWWLAEPQAPNQQSVALFELPVNGAVRTEEFGFTICAAALVKVGEQAVLRPSAIKITNREMLAGIFAPAQIVAAKAIVASTSGRGWIVPTSNILPGGLGREWADLHATWRVDKGAFLLPEGSPLPLVAHGSVVPLTPTEGGMQIHVFPSDRALRQTCTEAAHVSTTRFVPEGAAPFMVGISGQLTHLDGLWYQRRSAEQWPTLPEEDRKDLRRRMATLLDKPRYVLPRYATSAMVSREEDLRVLVADGSLVAATSGLRSLQPITEVDRELFHYVRAALCVSGPLTGEEFVPASLTLESPEVLAAIASAFPEMLGATNRTAADFAQMIQIPAFRKLLRTALDTMDSQSPSI